MQSESPTLLFIDDEELSLFVNEQIALITYPNARILKARSVAEGISILEKELDILTVFVDITMPGESGFDFLDKVCVETSQKKFFMLTSSIDNRDIEKSKEFNCVGAYFVKPLSGRILRLALEENNLPFFIGDNAKLTE